MNPRIGRLLRIALTLLVIAIVASRIDGRALARTFRALGPAQIASLLGLVLAQQLLLTKRFATVLSGLARTASPRLRDLLVDQQVGTAYNVVLPSAVGGDVIRAMRAQRRMGGEQVAEAWGAVLLDRLLGLLALALVPLFGLLLDAHRVPNVLMRTAAGLVILLAPLSLFAGRVFRFVAKVGTRVPRLAKFCGDVATVLDAAPASLRLIALSWSLAYQIAVSAFFHVAAAAFGIPLELAFPAIWIGLPLVFVLSVVPITIGGLGLRESLFVGVLGLYGVSAEAALALALTWGAQGLLTALAGVIAVWCEKAPERVAG